MGYTGFFAVRVARTLEMRAGIQADEDGGEEAVSDAVRQYIAEKGVVVAPEDGVRTYLSRAMSALQVLFASRSES